MRFFVLSAFVLGCCFAFSSPAAAQKIDFNRDVRPIISNHCLACHGPDNTKRESGLRLDDRDSATKVLESGHTAIVGGNLAQSELVARISSDDESIRMPPADFSKPLTLAEISTLTRWVEQGGEFAQHWAYVKPVRAAVPPTPDAYASWPKNPIDNFALYRMLELRMKPSEQADARTLVRRLFLDLIGLPPTVEECDEWAQRLEAGTGNASAPKARTIDDAVYEQLVDHLFQRPEFGEHWARSGSIWPVTLIRQAMRTIRLAQFGRGATG
ncbi:MAG TPA: DUF1549 domain-containing protein [Planctomycetaceae bacterium]|nr:DUF1549 domain-containing protein [Planctomycetaceae bacterium]